MAKVVMTKSGKLRRTGSPTPSEASTRAETTVSVVCWNPPNYTYEALKAYLGGSVMPLNKYEALFGAVNRQTPFGENIWDGLLTYFGPGYVTNYGTRYHWCGDNRQYLPWLGAFNMP